MTIGASSCSRPRFKMTICVILVSVCALGSLSITEGLTSTMSGEQTAHTEHTPDHAPKHPASCLTPVPPASISSASVKRSRRGICKHCLSAARAFTNNFYSRRSRPARKDSRLSSLACATRDSRHLSATLCQSPHPQKETL
jgi:hypothetical protein